MCGRYTLAVDMDELAERFDWPACIIACPIYCYMTQESLCLQGYNPLAATIQLKAYEVLPLVNRSINDLPECIEALSK